MSDARWKRQERQVAVMLGSRRNPNNGEHRTDIDPRPFAVEHKARKSLPAWLTGALPQPTAGAHGRKPIGVLSEARQDVKATRYVLVGVAHRADWYGSPHEA